MGTRSVENTETTRLVIVDGNNLVCRNLFAFAKAGLVSPQGKPSGALLGTMRNLMGIVERFSPTHMLWCFDHGRSAMRTELQPDYKGHRKYAAKGAVEHNPMEDLPVQIEAFTSYLQMSAIASFSEADTEADDLIAAAVIKWRYLVDEIMIVSGDHDLLQLVSDFANVSVFRPGEKDDASGGGSVGLAGKSAHQFLGALYDEARVRSKYGDTAPSRLPQVWALTGDTSDNIKGVPGVGPKTAEKWLHKHATLANIVSREPKCEGYERQCFTNLKLIDLLNTSPDLIPFDLVITRYYPEHINRPAVSLFLQEWGLDSLRRELAA